MSCCGQGRAALRNSQATQTPKTPRSGGSDVVRIVGNAAPHAKVPIRYLGAAPIVVRGAISGQPYRFSLGHAVQPVDTRDVVGLLKKGIFRRST